MNAGWGPRCAAAVAAAAIGLTLAGPATAQTTPPTAPGPPGGAIRQNSRPVPGQYIVKLRSVSPGAVGQVAEALARGNQGTVLRTYRSAMRGFAVRMTEQQAAALAASPYVEYVEEDGFVSATDTQANPPWGVDRTDQRALPLDGSYTYDTTGAGVRAYIIDTGIRKTHTDFGGRAIDGVDTIDGSLPADDCYGHGTHVAGTVGGSTYGIAKGVTLVAVRVLDCQGSGTWSQVIQGVDWVTADHQTGQPAVANMSLGGGASSALDDAVANSTADGVTYAVAAGNSNANACNYSPARAPSALTVGATTSSDAKASYSNYGSCLDLFAPGDSVTSDYYSSDTATRVMSGTSMATPHVAGVAALYLEGHPSASPATVSDALKTDATPGVVGGEGTGSPDLLLFAAPIQTPPISEPTTSSTTSSSSSTTSSSTTSSSTTSSSTTSSTTTTTTTTPPPSGVTEWRSPTAQAALGGGDANGYQTNPTSAFANDGVFAVDTNSGTSTSTSCTSSYKDKHQFSGYGIAVPDGEVVNGIEVQLQARADSTSYSPKVCVQLSWNGGSSWTTAKTTPTVGTSEATYVLGSASDLWGRTWSNADVTDANLRMRVIDVSSSTSRDFSLDWIAVRVHHSPPPPPPEVTAWKSPTAQAVNSGGDGNGYQTSPENAFVDDGAFAVDTNSGNGTSTSCTSSSKDKHQFSGYGVALPSGATVNGIEVQVQARADSTSYSPKICAQLSWDGGVSWTTAKLTPTVGTGEGTYVLGSASDPWGHTWTSGELTDTNLRVRVIDVSSSTSRDFSLDWIGVRVTYVG